MRYERKVSVWNKALTEFGPRTLNDNNYVSKLLKVSNIDSSRSTLLQRREIFRKHIFVLWLSKFKICERIVFRS